MKNKLWHYGDSFAECGSFEKIFSYYIAEHYNMDLRHCGMGGSGNFKIFSDILSNDTHYKEGDFVLINWSFFSRNTLLTIEGKLIGVDNLLINFPDETQKSQIDSNAKNFLMDLSNDWSFMDSVKMFNYLVYPYCKSLVNRGIKLRMIFLEQFFPENTNRTMFYNKIPMQDSIVTDKFSEWILKFEPHYCNWFVSRDLMKDESSHYAKGIQPMIAEEYIKRIG